MKNVIIGVVLSTIIFIGLGWLMVGRGGSTTTPIDLGITQEDNQTSSASATLVEYSDFQCPACGAYHELVSQLKDDLGDRLNIVYRHFPLRNIHPNAQLAAQAAQAAALQGKFWQMHDKLFENQLAWSELEDPTDSFKAYATELELDIDQFTTDLTSKAVEDRVNRDYASAIRFGINSTPTFFLNGVKMTNPASYETFKQIIEAKLQ